MGVPSFFYWIFKNYPQIVHQVEESRSNPVRADYKIPKIDVYALDLNAIIHPVCQGLFNKNKGSMMHPKTQKKITFEMIYKAVCDRVDELYKLILPRKKFVIAIDGCCPIAKQSQQRLRRFKSVKEKSVEEIKNFDSNCISVGTEFLEGFSEYLVKYTKQKIRNSEWVVEVIISNHKVPGEGEHKIIRLFANKYKKLICLLHSPDADLIMLSLASNHPNLYILRENVYTNVLCKYLFIKVNGENDSLKDVLYFLIRDKMPVFSKEGEEKREEKTNDLNRISIDFIFMCFFFGNDFFAKIHSLEINTDSMRLMIDIYKEFLKDGKYLIDYHNKEYNINFESLKSFLKLLSENERKFLGQKTKVRNEILKDLSLERNTREIDKEIDFDKYRNEFYELNLFMKSEDSKVISGDQTKYYKEYFRALSFCLKYYTMAIPDWHYFFPYHYTPFFTDLYNYLRVSDVPSYSFDLHSPLLPFEQLFSILPVESFHLLPTVFKEYMETKLIDLYPTDFYIDLEGKKYEHEAVVLLPFSNIGRMKSVCEEIYKKNVFTDKEKERNSVGKTVSFKKKV